MSIERAALAAFYPVIVMLCFIGCVRFWPARKNLSGANKTLVTGVIFLMCTLGIETTYYGITRLHPPFYDVFGWNVWLVGSMKIAYIWGLSLILRAYWEITDATPGKWVPGLTAVCMWIVLTTFVFFT